MPLFIVTTSPAARHRPSGSIIRASKATAARDERLETELADDVELLRWRGVHRAPGPSHE